MLVLSLAFLVAAFFLAGVLARKIRVNHPDLYIKIGEPLTYEWYPLWTFRLLSNRKYRLLGSIEAGGAFICMMCMSLGLILGGAWVYMTFVAH